MWRIVLRREVSGDCINNGLQSYYGFVGRISEHSSWNGGNIAHQDHSKAFRCQSSVAVEFGCVDAAVAGVCLIATVGKRNGFPGRDGGGCFRTVRGSPLRHLVLRLEVHRDRMNNGLRSWYGLLGGISEASS